MFSLLLTWIYHSFLNTWLLYPVVVYLVVYSMYRIQQWYIDPNRKIPSASWFRCMSQIGMPMSEVTKIWYQKLGRLHWCYAGFLRILIVGEKEIVEKILIKDAQEFFPIRRDIKCGNPYIDKNVSLLGANDFIRVRRIISHAFGKRSVTKMMNNIYFYADDAVDQMTKAGQEQAIDLYKIIEPYVMSVLTKCLFNVEIDRKTDPDNKFIWHARNMLSAKLTWGAFLAGCFPDAVSKFFGVPAIGLPSVDFFRDFAFRVIGIRNKEERNTSDKETSMDFLQYLLDARNPKKESKTYIEDDELIAQCVIVFLAGFETISSVVRGAIAHMAWHENVQEKLYNEISSLEKKPSFETIEGLTYLDSVVSETMRLHPAAIRMDRTAEKDCEYSIEDENINVKKIKLKKGQVVSIPIYCMNRDPEWYDDPETFNPDRFASEARPQRLFIPFSKGFRACLGSVYALIVMKIMLIQIISHFKVKYPPYQQYPFPSNEKQGQLLTGDVDVIAIPRNLEA